MGTAAATVVALVAGGIVAGLGIQGALAAELAPVVSVTSGDTVLAGQDIELTVQVGANPQAANDQYNLSVAVLLPSGATVIGSELPATATYVDGAVVPGKYVATIALCSSVGLELANNRCVVPAGKQYLVFENISDLPKSAAKSFGLTVRPDATVFPVGAQFPVAVSAYTSDNERTLPIFPGSSSKQTSTAATSARGGDTLNVPISALRIEKAALSGVTEGKMLRGVHSKTGVYELTVFHTGQEPATGVVVNDFLDAGLEFLGCGTEDNSTAANGTRTDALEYPNAAILGSGAVANCVDPALVETITADAATAQQYNLVAGKVYTKVTWNLGNLDPALNGGGPQAYAGTKGVPGEVKLAYRVGIPLFENTMDFGAQTPTPASGQQGSNLDNNRGASTAHGARVDDANSAQLAAQDATKLTNTAAVQGSTATGGSVIDVDALTVEAEDVRQVKTVTTAPIASAADLATASFGKSATFETGQIATYRLRIETSEYAGAALDATPVTRVIDELGNGCPTRTTRHWTCSVKSTCRSRRRMMRLSYASATFSPSCLRCETPVHRTRPEWL